MSLLPPGMVLCPCGAAFAPISHQGRPRKWCYECRPTRARAYGEDLASVEQVEVQPADEPHGEPRALPRDDALSTTTAEQPADALVQPGGDADPGERAPDAEDPTTHQADRAHDPGVQQPGAGDRPEPDQDLAEAIAVVREDGSLAWQTSGEPVLLRVGFPAGAQLLLTTPNEHHEIVGVIRQRPSGLAGLTSTRQRWRAAMFKKSQSLERRIADQWDRYQQAEETGGALSVVAINRLELLEIEAQGYNEMARELDLPLLRVEIPEKR